MHQARGWVELRVPRCAVLGVGATRLRLRGLPAGLLASSCGPLDHFALPRTSTPRRASPCRPSPATCITWRPRSCPSWLQTCSRQAGAVGGWRRRRVGGGLSYGAGLPQPCSEAECSVPTRQCGVKSHPLAPPSPPHRQSSSPAPCVSSSRSRRRRWRPTSAQLRWSRTAPRRLEGLSSATSTSRASNLPTSASPEEGVAVKAVCITHGSTIGCTSPAKG